MRLLWEILVMIPLHFMFQDFYFNSFCLAEKKVMFMYVIPLNVYFIPFFSQDSLNRQFKRTALCEEC